MPNALAAEKSPYLLQHAHNPVDWMPWGDAAFEKATRENKPVFLSVGYATCHWCHVMERESFEDEAAAAALNDVFVCIKVDREERPDVDAVYMAVCQAMTGHGGWPLTVLLTPDREPFWAGTYLPKESRGGRLGVIELAERVSALWNERRADLEAQAAGLAAAVRNAFEEAPPATDPLSAAVLTRGADALAERFDAEWGGFGRQPKFPTPHLLLFLLRHWKRTDDERALQMATETLRRMAAGGIHDQAGGGFHRYSTDQQWRLPHFEKMLYDQALLLMAYAEAHAATGRADFRDTAERIAAYVLRDLTGPPGAFFSAEDADSLDAHGEMEEGAFYVWTETELDDLLGPDADLAKRHFGTAPAGNYRDEATRQLTGANVLTRAVDADTLAAALHTDLERVEYRLQAIRDRLLAARADRPRPLLDDKVLADWNGLMIAALALAGRLLEKPEWTAAATRAADFVLSEMRDESAALLHRFRDGEAALPATLNDYAYLGWGLFELYQATFDVRWLREAAALQEEIHARFQDEARGGFFLIEKDQSDLPARPKELYDGAIPSANGAAAYNALRLGRLLGREEWVEVGRRALAASADLAQHPDAHAFHLVAAAFLDASREVVLVGDEEMDDLGALLAVWRRTYAPDAVALFRPADETAADLLALAPDAQPMTPVAGKAAAYVCRQFTCDAPIAEAEALAERLG
jgi:uncharacterized protein YyaL (SSP411 family)